ncbi:MAG: hypothetical protein H6835_02160 [Planctomycetes bacterium]|nr:hypothetical protein [Planctomycetota bacterium]
MTVNTLGTDSRLGGDPLAAGSTRRSWTENRWPLLAICIALFSISALVYYHLYRTGLEPTKLLPRLFAGIYDFVGLAPAVIFFLMVAAWGTIWLHNGALERPLARLGRLLMMAALLGVALNLGDGGVAEQPHKGAFGAWLAHRLVDAIGPVPTMVLVWPATFAALMLATEWFFAEYFERLRRPGQSESGVEAAVTDHLRGLSQAIAPASLRPATRVEPAAPATLRAAAAPQVFAELLGGADEEVAAAPPAEPQEVAGDESTVDDSRPGYAERRAARQARRAAFAEPQDALPEAGEVEVTESVGAERGDEPPMDEGSADDSYGEDRSQGEDRASDELEDGEPMLQDPVEQDLESDGAVIEDEFDVLLAQPPGARVAGAPSEVPRPSPEQVPEEGLSAVELFELMATIDDPAPSARESVAAAASDVVDSDGSPGEFLAAADSEETGVGEAGAVVADAGQSVTGGGDLEAQLPDEGEADEREGSHPGPERDVQQPSASDVPTGFIRLDGAALESPVAADATAADEDEVEPEPLHGEAERSVSIPRPDSVHPSVPTPPVVKQQQLFGGADEGLVQEAIDVVTDARRATAALLQRKLRVDYELACELLRELASRGVVALEDDASRARVLDG